MIFYYFKVVKIYLFLNNNEYNTFVKLIITNRQINQIVKNEIY